MDWSSDATGHAPSDKRGDGHGDRGGKREPTECRAEQRLDALGGNDDDVDLLAGCQRLACGCVGDPVPDPDNLLTADNSLEVDFRRIDALWQLDIFCCVARQIDSDIPPGVIEDVGDSIELETDPQAVTFCP